MNLEFDGAVSALIDDASDVFNGLSPLADLRAGVQTETWTKLVSAGWSNLGFELETGGLELSAAAGIFRQAGRALLIEQYVTTGYLLSALSAHVVPEDRDVIINRLAHRPGVILGDGRGSMLRHSASATDVCFGVEETADIYRVVTVGDSTYLEVADAASARVGRVADLSLGVGTVQINAPTWQRLTLDGGHPLVTRLEESAMVLHSSALVGCAERLLQDTRDYTLARVQFNVPIGSFQAVRHSLADVSTSLSVAWSAVLAAVAQGGQPSQRALVARYLAVQAALLSARAGAQFYGGIGFAWEADVHWFLKTLLDGSQRFGSTEDIAERIGRKFMEEAC